MFNCRFHTCFGFLSFWDWIYGTDQDFEDSVQSDRHIRQEEQIWKLLPYWFPTNLEFFCRLQTLKSARELFPDEKKEE